MKTQTLVVGLSAINLVLLVLTAAQAMSREDVSPILRAHEIELVDDHGLVRSRLEIKPGSGVVLLQLFDQKGIIKVKLGAGEDGSGMFLADETQNSGVQIIARQSGTSETPKTTSITLTGKNGQQRIVAP
jgi:hypothetical protein